MGGRSQLELEQARSSVARRLTSLYKTWTVEEGVVIGPGTLAVRVEDHHQMSAAHLDIGFVLNRDRTDAPVLWDCVAGVGSTSEEALDRAVETWTVSTLPVFLEQLVLDGSFAEHFDGGDPEGCPPWHVIHGPIIAFGKEDAPDVLQAWALENSLLPVIGPIAAAGFERPILNCVKMLFGFGTDDIAEVRVNGRIDERASTALRSLRWPRSANAAFARLFLLFVTKDE